MTDAPDHMQIAINHYGEWEVTAGLQPEIEGGTSYTRSDIAPKVKPLKWDEIKGSTHLFAGCYEISLSGNKERVVLHYHYVVNGFQKTKKLLSGYTLDLQNDEIKAAAQAHHDALILSALETQGEG